MLPMQVERAIADSYSHKLTLADNFDRALRGAVAEIKTAVMCGKGCNHCCYYPTYISALEAIPIYRHLGSKGRWTPALRKQLQKHAETTTALAPEVWMLSQIACPLLDDKGHCIAYAARPLSCHLMYSTRDPHLCHPHREGIFRPMPLRIPILGEFSSVEARYFKANGAQHFMLPISKALSLAESLCSGELDFDAMNTWIYKEYEAHR